MSICQARGCRRRTLPGRRRSQISISGICRRNFSTIRIRPIGRCAKRDPVHRMPDGSYFLTRYDDCLRVYRDPQRWSSDKKTRLPPEFRRQPALRASHHEPGVQRSALSHAGAQALGARFHAARAERAAARVEALVERLLDAPRKSGEIDLIDDFAAAIPVQLIGDMLGMPPDEREPLRGWSLAILGALEPVLTARQFDTGVAAVADFKDLSDAIIIKPLAHRPGRPGRNPVEADRRQRLRGSRRRRRTALRT